MRAAIDAVVAGAYILNREQYASILRSFPHREFSGAPALCLRAFDILLEEGLESFCQKEIALFEAKSVRAKG